MQILVRDNNVDQALKVLKKKMQRELPVTEQNSQENNGCALVGTSLLRAGDDG